MIVALVNQKGGVGKTTCAVNLSAATAEKGKRVLLIDMDPQANSTSTVAPTYSAGPDVFSVNDVLASGAEGVAASAIITSDWHPNLHVLPSELELTNRERESPIGMEQRLRRALIGVADDYDLVLIDCPPNVGILTANALVAADYALLVSELGAHSFHGLVNIRESVAMVRDNYSSTLRIAGIVINRARIATVEDRARKDEVLQAFGDQVWHPFIPEKAAIKAATGANTALNRFPGPAAEEAWSAFSELAEQLLSLSPVEPAKV
jgi:chromosome partitioning protein